MVEKASGCALHEVRLPKIRKLCVVKPVVKVKDVMYTQRLGRPTPK